MAIRISCTIEGMEENWIEYDLTGWTLRDTTSLDVANGERIDDMFEMLRNRATGVHIESNAGDITEPDGLTYDAMLDVDELLIGWLTQSIYTAIGNRRVLGNVSARVSSTSNGTRATATTMTAAKS